MPSIEHRPDRPKPWRAIYWGPDGKRHSRSFARESDAKRWLTSEEAAKLQGTWADLNQGRRRFNDWADEWWAVWSSDPGRSPKTLEAAESHLRLHIRSHFGTRQLRAITVHAVQQWQYELAGRASYNLTMACRSILNRIMQAATDDRLISFNPVSRVKPPKRSVDPEVIFGRVRRRTFSPEEFGQFLAACPAFYRDHFLTQVATGLRSGELLGLRERRVDLARRRIEVIDVRYDAGRFGAGYKNRPKSDASIRVVPLAEPAAEAVARRLVGCPPGGLVFGGPGGSHGVKRGERSMLSTGNYRRVYKAAVATAALPHLDLRGPHDLRHTYATWLEDGGIPSRVIDELMGHQGGRHGERGSPMGLAYRHTTPEMQARLVAVIEARLVIVSGVVLQPSPNGDQTARPRSSASGQRHSDLRIHGGGAEGI
jgi:integrase